MAQWIHQDLTSQVDGVRTVFDLLDLKVYIPGHISVSWAGIDQQKDVSWEEVAGSTQIRFCAEAPEVPDTVLISFQESISGEPDGDFIAAHFTDSCPC